MYVVIDMSLDLYDRFVDACPRKSREYAVLKNGLIFRRTEGDRFIEIWCIESDAHKLCNLACTACTDAIEPIKKAIASPREDLSPAL
jgi:hypothetical protein